MKYYIFGIMLLILVLFLSPVHVKASTNDEVSNTNYDYWFYRQGTVVGDGVYRIYQYVKYDGLLYGYKFTSGTGIALVDGNTGLQVTVRHISYRDGVEYSKPVDKFDLDGSNLDDVNLYQTNIVIFKTKVAMNYYRLNGVLQNKDDVYLLPDGYVVSDENKVVLSPTKYDKSIGLPLKLKMYRQYAKDTQHWTTYVSWENPKDLRLDMKLQIEVGGYYEVRPHWYSVSGTQVVIPFQKYDYNRSPFTSPFSFQNGTFKSLFTDVARELYGKDFYETNSFPYGYKFRMRYFYVDKNNVTRYGPWVVTSSDIDKNDGSSAVVITDDKDNEIDSDDYTGEDKDYNFKEDLNGQVDSNGNKYKPVGLLEWVNNLINGITDFFTSLIDMVSSLTQSVGNIPKIIGVLLVGVPKQIWDTLLLGLTLLISLGIIKIIRG